MRGVACVNGLELVPAMRQPPDPREDEDDGEEGDGMEPTLPLDQTLNNCEPVCRRGQEE